MVEVLIICGFIAACALLNRARGSRFFDWFDSTTEGRLLSMFGIALLCAALARYHGISTDKCIYVLASTWATLLFWCVFAWDNYWGAAIGSKFDPNKPTFAPVDWIMKKLYPVGPASGVESLQWGGLAMTYRCALILPSIYVNAALCDNYNGGLWSVLYGLMGWVYVFWGRVSKYPIEYSEYCIGALIGVMQAGAILGWVIRL